MSLVRSRYILVIFQCHYVCAIAPHNTRKKKPCILLSVKLAQTGCCTRWSYKSRYIHRICIYAIISVPFFPCHFVSAIFLHLPFCLCRFYAIFIVPLYSCHFVCAICVPFLTCAIFPVTFLCHLFIVPFCPCHFRAILSTCAIFSVPFLCHFCHCAILSVPFSCHS